ncbi:RNA polymerase sigma-70 factor [Prevotella denticola DNF00960]|uniref:sigma-70 family RNA polymerase sigma factor n=1 Tax=Prevotella denticola TaxID=28129 RepID=UPI00050F9AE3|nr:sigma-70 family RNA polymerase sigma factor [Prevotella denticola]KGF43069.1 RNA polymerase sigma-70 factor [Prevotella denticola DNF00960]
MIQIDACKNGDKEALGELYTTYADRLLGVCRHYVKDDDSARDVLHDAFIIIFTSIRDLKDESKLEGWMIAIVRNLSLKYLQSTEKGTIPLSCLDIELQEKEREGRKDIELGLLLAAIESLPEGNREVFRLSVLDGLSHKEIGGLLGINPHSSSSQLFRAKKMLRTILMNYWMLFLLPILIPVYIYFVTRDESASTSDDKPTAVNTHKELPRRAQKGTAPQKKAQPNYSIPSTTNLNDDHILAKIVVSAEEISSQIITDSVKSGQQTVPICVDSLQKHLAVKDISIEDSVFRIPQIPEERMMALNERMSPDVRNKKKYPWTFNFGYSSNAGANGVMSNLNYLSVVDYANGGAAAKLYTWDDYVNYLVRNNALMDSVERAKMSWIALNNATEGNASLGEKAHHYRPQTFSLSLNKQLSSHWTFGTGLTYTRMKSDFESEFHGATLLKTQKIDYVGIPLRLTYRIWSKGRFNAYTTGGVTFEMPVHSSLDKKYIITSDSSYTLKGDIKPRYQWSVNLGIGVQYRLFKPFSLYLEPNMFYYFWNGSGLETYRTEHPFIITVPFGLRLTW